LKAAVINFYLERTSFRSVAKIFEDFVSINVDLE